MKREFVLLCLKLFNHIIPAHNQGLPAIAVNFPSDVNHIEVIALTLTNSEHSKCDMFCLGFPWQKTHY